jgi:hypothetical protein
VAFVTLFIVLAAEKASGADNLAGFKDADNEVAGRIALAEPLSGGFDRGLEVLLD